ncbi:MAG: tetratricopeptide repeat protein [Caldilineaceae bacterium]|nr:tetratricopeptide repeat protein [Caldilineaceae bacterium]
MIQLSDFPHYIDNLSVFLLTLRSALGATQAEIAELCYLDRTRITRYENRIRPDRPPQEYMALLVMRLAERYDNDPQLVAHLLNQVNTAIRLEYDLNRYRTWSELTAAALAYQDQQQKKRRPNFDQRLEEWNAVLAARVGPTPHSQLFGINAYRHQLVDALRGIGNYSLIAVEGLGGLGKSALLDAAVRDPEVGRCFDDLVWVSLPQRIPPATVGIGTTQQRADRIAELQDLLLQNLGLTAILAAGAVEREYALTAHLQQARRLIVVDNLESALDVAALIPYLEKLVFQSSGRAGKNRVLLATRRALSPSTKALQIRLQPLARGDAIRLLRYKSRQRDPDMAVRATDAQFGRIYDQVGGNPMALRLVVGQIAVFSLTETLAILSRVKDNEVDEFYTYIFRQSWQALEDGGRALLSVMPLAPNATLEQLAALVELERTDLNAALRSLDKLLLIEPIGTLDARRYRIHRLTELFLLKQIVAWQRVGGVQEEKTVAQFRYAIQLNGDYWLQWLTDHSADVSAVDKEREGIVKAIDFALDEPAAWASATDLIHAFTIYMESHGYWIEWQQILEKGLRAARQRAQSAELPALLVLMGRLTRLQSHYQDSVQYYRQAIAAARLANDRYDEARACTNLSYHFCEAGQLQRAKVLCCHALDLFLTLENAHGLAHTYNHLGLIAIRQKNWEKAEEYLKQAMEIWSEGPDRHGLIDGMINLGLLYSLQQQHEQALNYAREALETAQTLGEEWRVGRIYVNMAWIYEDLADSNAAEAVIAKASVIFQQLSSPYGMTLVEEHLGVIRLMQGRFDEAETHLLAAFNGWETLGDKKRRDAILPGLADARAGKAAGSGV